MNVVDKLVARGQLEWPAIRVERGAVAAQLAGCADVTEDRELDVYLAAACAGADPAALAVLETEVLRATDAVIRRVRGDAMFVEEVKQEVRLRLFAPPNPRIRQFAARGSLRGWVRTIAAKIALDVLAGARTEDVPAPSDLPDTADDIDLALLQRRHGAAFTDAFAFALGELEARDRTVLHLYLVERKTLAEVAAILEVDRTTIVRWLVRSRERLLDRLKARLIDVLALDAGEVSTLIRALRRAGALELGDALL
jgi:RNA polymerase sigma-70 factor, ECF subfamily